MAVSKQQKQDILQELIDKFSRSKSVVFADYRGLDVKNISDLRTKLREGDAEAKVAKKTLIRLAAKDQKIGEIPSDFMEGPVAAVFSYEDELAGIQILYKFSKDHEELNLLGGIIEGEVVGPDVVKKYAQLPTREELLAKLVGSMQSPISGTVGILGNLVSGFVRVLNAYKDTLPADGAATASKEEDQAEKPAEETPKEEAKADESSEESKGEQEESQDAISNEEAEKAEDEAANKQEEEDKANA